MSKNIIHSLNKSNTMSIQTLQQLYAFELGNLHKEINAYTKDENLWLVQSQVNNSAGNLCLHLIGNVNYFIGTLVGNTGYVRNRDAEFNDKHQTKAELLLEIEKAIPMLNSVFEKATEDDIQKIYPIDFMGKQTTEFYLTRFLAHFSYHLGQITYHRRLLDV